MSICDRSSPQYPCPEPNPDISGLGVSTFSPTYPTITNSEKVFVSSLVIGVAATISAFCQAYLRTKIENCVLRFMDVRQIERRNREDPAVRLYISENSVVKRCVFWCDALERIIISLADTQIVTGYALLVTAYTRLPSPVSHLGRQQPAQFGFVVLLSGLSGSTHLACMAALDTYLNDHPTLAKIRFGLMILFGVFLVLSTGFLSASGHSVIGPTCLYCIVGYLGIIMHIVLGMKPWLLKRFARDPTKDGIWFTNRPYCNLLFTTIILFMSRPYYNLLCTPILLVGTFLLAILQKFNNHCGGKDICPGHNAAEDVWSFGQVLPLFMFLLPVFSMLEIYLELEDKEKTANNASPVIVGSDSLIGHIVPQPLIPQTTNDSESAPASPSSATADQDHADLQSSTSDIELHSIESHESDTQQDEPGSAVVAGESRLNLRTASTFPTATSWTSSSQSNAEHFSPPLRRQTAGQMVQEGRIQYPHAGNDFMLTPS